MLPEEPAAVAESEKPAESQAPVPPLPGLAERSPWRLRAVAAFFVLAWAAGLVFRLGSPGLIEYKGDEAWMFHRTMEIVHGSPWPPTGMESSVGLVNPGLSLWIFPLLAKVTGAHTPVELARAVQLMNCLALTLVFLFAWRRPQGERGVWLWTAALAAVDPIAIVLQRKIWAQSTLPLIVWLAFLGWHGRRRFGWAFLWGLCGALVGQIHMTGFLFVPVFVLWGVWANVRRTDRFRTSWFGWLGGSVVGAIPLVPWLLYLQRGGAGTHINSGEPHRPFYWRMWIEDALGVNLDYSLGPHTARMLSWPVVNGQATWIVEGCLGVTVVIAGYFALALLWRTVRAPRDVFARLRQEDAVAHNLAFVAYGLIVTVLGINLFRHYLLIAFPFEAMTLPLLGSLGKRRLAWLLPAWIAHAFVVLMLQQYLLKYGGAPGGDFGRAFQFQGRVF